MVLNTIIVFKGIYVIKKDKILIIKRRRQGQSSKSGEDTNEKNSCFALAVHEKTDWAAEALALRESGCSAKALPAPRRRDQTDAGVKPADCFGLPDLEPLFDQLIHGNLPMKGCGAPFHCKAHSVGCSKVQKPLCVVQWLEPPPWCNLRRGAQAAVSFEVSSSYHSKKQAEHSQTIERFEWDAGYLTVTFINR